MNRHISLLSIAFGWLVCGGLVSCASSCHAPERAGTNASRPTTGADPKLTSSTKTEPPRWQRPRRLIDSHVHITPLPEAFNLATAIFSQVGVEKFALKSAGAPGTARYAATVQYGTLFGDRMAWFINPDWEDIDDSGWANREVRHLEQAMREGASGIKIFKALGLGVRLMNGQLLKVTDPRLEPLWRRAGELGAIVAWHVADPVAFFKPVTPDNERYEELSMAPDWSFYGKDYPSFESLMAAQSQIVLAHPQTIFLGIHFGNYAESLEENDRLLDKAPNFYIDTSARLGEIGRHPPDAVRRFFIKHQDRILFGTDLIVSPDGMQLGSVSKTPPTFKDALRFFADHRHYFESADRRIDHPTPSQGRWKINAIDLPEDVLQKFYYDNADKLIFGPRRAWLSKAQGAAQAK